MGTSIGLSRINVWLVCILLRSGEKWLESETDKKGEEPKNIYSLLHNAVVDHLNLLANSVVQLYGASSNEFLNSGCWNLSNSLS